MKKQAIVNGINKYLADEMLRYEDVELFLDRTIDDINQDLNAKFPSFSEHMASDQVDADGSYEFFPDRYIRSVVIIGAAFYFYQADEEGERVAGSYHQMYQENRYKMTRDYMMMVPEEFIDDKAGYVEFKWHLDNSLGVDYRDLWSDKE